MNGDDHPRPQDSPDESSSDDAVSGRRLSSTSPPSELLEAARRGTDRLATASDGDHGDLWGEISRAAFGDDVDQDAPAGAPQPRASHGRRPEPFSAPGPSPAGSRRRHPRLVHSTERRQRRAVAAALVGVAATLLAVIGVSWVVAREPAPQPVATFRMEPLDERVTTGVEGRLVATDTGQAIEVDLDGLPPAPADSFYELWLLDLDAGRLVSLGPVDPDSTYAVPPAVAAASWPIIDVSVEPVDGDPTHSSDSVLRGPVVATGPTN